MNKYNNIYDIFYNDKYIYCGNTFNNIELLK